jgi:predicted transcriptional regulator
MKRPTRRTPEDELSRRERQILDVLLERGRATAEEIRAALPDPPSNSGVRTLLGRLEEKGFADHAADGPRYLYRPAISPAAARDSAVARLVRVFFDGSMSQAVAGLVDMSVDRLPDAELERLEALIADVRRERSGG